MSNLITPPLFLRILILTISLFFFGAIIYFLLKTDWLKRLLLEDLVEFLSFKPYEMRKIPKRWEKISRRLEKGLESEIKLAIIEADDLLNEVLERIGYPAKTLGEKLKQVPKTTLPSQEEVWQAHQIRSDIAHDPTYRLSFSQAVKILEVYKRALSELEAL